MEKVPSFIVVGCPKCGTTSLYFYLKQHPAIFLPTQKKELHYFSSEMLAESDNGPGDKIALERILKTKDEYLKVYSEMRNETLAGDISPSYFHYGLECAKKIKNMLPNVNILIFLRNPIQKAYSQYMHQVREGVETLSFAEALAQEKGRKNQGWRDFWQYVETSLYTENIRSYFEIFGKERVKVLFFEDFISNKVEVLDEICVFIGAEPVKWDVSRHLNKSGIPRYLSLMKIISNPPKIVKWPVKLLTSENVRHTIKDKLVALNLKSKPEIEPEVYDELIRYFRDDVKSLEEILERKAPWKGFN